MPIPHHHERALCILRALGYLSGPLSISRFNRRFHALAHRLSAARDLLAVVFAVGEIFVLDSIPLPVCPRARAGRCTKVRGGEYCGYCAAKRAKFFGWRLHLVVTPRGIPVSFDRVPAAFHDLTPVHELMERLPAGAAVYADKAYNGADDEALLEGETGIRLIPRRRANMAINPNNALRNFYRICAKATVQRSTIHGMWHTQATWLIRAGRPANEVAARLGHAKPSITLDTYAHVAPDAQDASVEAVRDLLFKGAR